MNKIKSLKNIFRTSGTRHGAYSVGLTVLVLAVVIVFNLIVGQIPEAYRNLDVSSTKIYDISDTTTELLDSLDSAGGKRQHGRKDHYIPQPVCGAVRQDQCRMDRSGASSVCADRL